MLDFKFKSPPFSQTNISLGMDQDQVTLDRALMVDFEVGFGLGPPQDHGLEVGFRPGSLLTNLRVPFPLNERGKSKSGSTIRALIVDKCV